eukprot:s2179_g4.t1
MKLTDLLTSVGTGSQQNRRLTSFQGLGNPFAPQGGPPGPAGGGAGGGDSGDWWQDESGKWHFGGEAEHWWRDEHHQWHKGGESQTWRQDEAGNWHEVDEDHPRESEDELLMGGNPDMGEPQQDIKDLDALNDALKEDMPPMFSSKRAVFFHSVLSYDCNIQRSVALMRGQAVAVAGTVLLLAVQAGRQDATDIFHPGHEAVHVTRLHRYEHDGMASFLEAEARWKGSREEVVSPLLSRARSKRSASQKPKGFLRVSQTQEAALKAHQTASLLQELEGARTNSSTIDGSFRNEGKVLRYHGLEIPNENHPAETRLTSLESQYIGQIGVGSVLAPKGCTPSSESLIYLGPADYDSATEEQKNTCHVRDQSLVWVVFDTGSTNIWVSSVLCTKGPCANADRSRYDRSLSRTYAPGPGGTLQIEFGTGRITGPEAVDDFHIGPFSVFNQTFGMIESEEGRVFEEVPVEGILGLAFPAMAAHGIRPFVDGIIENKAIGRNEFAFYFSRLLNRNSRSKGGVDKSFYHGEIEYFPVVQPYYWAIELVDFKIGEDSLLHLLLPEAEETPDLEHKGHSGHKKHHHHGAGEPMFKAIVDTGTTFFTAQGRLFKEIMKRLAAGPCRSLTKQSHPDITYTLKNTAGQLRDFVISNKQYMLSSQEGDDSECTPAFMLIEVPRAHGPGMVLGEVFLRIYFSAFDRGSGSVDEARIGFAKANSGADAKRLDLQPAGVPPYAHCILRLQHSAAVLCDPSFTPSIENIITKSGPSELGRNVAELSRALGQLKDDVNSNLSQDRIAAMTSEDVPNMVTPVAESLKEVIRSAKSMQDRLTAISDAAYSIVGTAAEDAERRLNGESPDEAAEGEADEQAGDWYGGDHGYHDDYYGQQGGYGGYGQGGYDQGHGAYGAGQWDQGGQGQGQGQGQGMHLASIQALAALALPALAVQVDLGKRSRHLRHKHPQLKSFF